MTRATGDLLDLSAHSGARGERTSLYSWYVLGVLFLVYVLNFIDRSILSILAQDIKAGLNLGDAQLGFLFGTAFSVFYALFGIPLGRLADSWYRGRLIALGLAVWSAMTALSGFAQSFGQLAAARLGVGIGEASASPAAYSLLADHFPARRRALVLAVYSSGLYIGAGISLPLGGWIARRWNLAYLHTGAPWGLAGWQAAFLAVGLPGLLLALLVNSLREPSRGAAEGVCAPVVHPNAWRMFALELAAIIPPFTVWSVARFPGALRRNLMAGAIIAAAAALLIRLTGDKPQWIALGIGAYALASWTEMLRATDRPTFTLLFGTPSIAIALYGFGAVAYFAYSNFFWGPQYAMRTFGVGTEVAGAMLGIPGAIASAAGCIAGGQLSDIWKRHDPRGRLFVCMLSAILPAPLLIAALSASDFKVFVGINVLTSFFGYLWIGPASATLQDCVLPRMRGTAGALLLLFLSLLGLGLGPYCTGKVSAVSHSLRTGMASMLVIMPVALLMLWMASRHIGAAESSRAARAEAAGESQAA